MQLKKRINSWFIILLCFTVFALVSCKSYYTALTIENPTPAKEELPDDIQSITLLNRSMNRQFMNHQVDSLNNYFYRNNYQLAAIVLDSVASDTIIKALSDLLYSSGRYDVVVPVERNIARKISYNMIPDTLSSEMVATMCSKYNTDALMVMEQFSTKAMADFNADRNGHYSGGYNNYYASLDIKYDAFFRIYKPGKLVKEIRLTDTINWENADNDIEQLFKRIPSVKQAVIDAGIKVALDIDGKISPSWKTEKRGYFVFKGKEDRGRKLIEENKITEARDYWSEMSQSKDRKIKSRAEFNLALASELEGNLDQAEKWALQSYNTRYHYQTEIYLRKLENRIATKQTK